MYIADSTNVHRIRKITVSTGIISTIAGTGTGSYSGDNGAATLATLKSPYGVAVDSSGMHGYFISVYFIILFCSFVSSGNVFISDTDNYRVRKVTASTGIITTFAGSGTNSFSGDGGAATSAALFWPYGIALDSSGREQTLFISHA